MTTAAKAKPIVFDAESVRAILKGAKTQTRRVVTPQPVGDDVRILDAAYDWAESVDGFVGGLTAGDHGYETTSLRCPFGWTDGLLWVKESYRLPDSLDGKTFAAIGEMALDAGYTRPWVPVCYEADGRRDNWDRSSWGEPGRIRNSRFMPRLVSRLTLHLTEVRVERVQDISEEDAIDEGVLMLPPTHEYMAAKVAASKGGTGRPPLGEMPSEKFRRRWDDLNKARGFPWADSPWVWALTFSRA